MQEINLTIEHIIVIDLIMIVMNVCVCLGTDSDFVNFFERIQKYFCRKFKFVQNTANIIIMKRKCKRGESRISIDL
jgi:hypothetical protein